MTFKPLYKKYEVNRGKVCKEPKCNHLARVKGRCIRCDHKIRIKYEKNKKEGEKTIQ